VPSEIPTIPSTHGPGQRLAAAAMAAGIDLEDQQAVAQLLAECNARPD